MIAGFYLDESLFFVFISVLTYNSYTTKHGREIRLQSGSFFILLSTFQEVDNTLKDVFNTSGLSTLISNIQITNICV